VKPVRRIPGPLEAFLHAETSGGVVLLAGTVAALGWANSPWRQAYADWWERSVSLGAGPLALDLTAHGWVNDALMAVFFFVDALEIKRELVSGELRDRRAAAMPALAALGGMVLPAVVFTAVTAGGPGIHGWAVPMATDIAFAVGVLALVGRGLPTGVRVFLLSLAIVDDLGAIVVIAAFYSGGISWPWLGVAVGVAAVVAAMKRLGASHPAAYLLPGAALWVATLESGVHATIAGVVLGMLTPVTARGRPVLERLERGLHPWSTFLVLPLFALANAGIYFGDGALATAFGSRVTWGVVGGLVVGKTVGVAVTVLVAERLGAGRRPQGLYGRRLWGTASLAGIGFTVSLFIAGLAFAGSPLLDIAKGAILVGSAIAGLGGWVILRLVPPVAPEDVSLSEAFAGED